MALFHIAAIGADVELGPAIIMGVRAADEGVERFHLVDETRPHEEVQGPVDRGRFGGAGPGFEGLEQVIGLHRTVGGQHEFQNTLAHRGQLLTAFDAVGFGGLEGPVQRIMSHLTVI